MLGETQLKRCSFKEKEGAIYFMFASFLNFLHLQAFPWWGHFKYLSFPQMFSQVTGALQQHCTTSSHLGCFQASALTPKAGPHLLCCPSGSGSTPPTGHTRDLSSGFPTTVAAAPRALLPVWQGKVFSVG